MVKNIFSFFKKYELQIRIIISMFLFLSFFIPFFKVANKNVDGEIGTYRTFSMFNTWKIYGQYIETEPFSLVVRQIYKSCGFSLFLPFILSIFSIFGYKKQFFNIIEKISDIIFLLFYTEIFLWLFSFGPYTETNYSVVPSFAFFIWSLLFIIDSIYIFHGLQKAYSKNQPKSQRIAELEERIKELEDSKKDE